MKTIEFTRDFKGSGRSVDFRVETCADGQTVVYLVYENGEIRSMCDSLISLLRYFNNTYGQTTMEIVKQYFQ